MAGPPLESPPKASSRSEYMQKMPQADEKSPSIELARRFMRMRMRTDISDEIAVSQSSSGRWKAESPSRHQSLERVTEGLLGMTTDIVGSSHAAHVASSSLPTDSNMLDVKVRVLETLISKVFSAVSTLRSSFLQMQMARLSSNWDMVETSERDVATHIRHLSELNKSFLERHATISAQSVEPGSSKMRPIDSLRFREHQHQQQQSFQTPLQQPQLQSQTQIHLPKDVDLLKSYEGIISNFHIEIRKRNAEVESLKDMLAESTLKNEKLEKKVKRLEKLVAKEVASSNEYGASISDGSVPTPQLLEGAVQESYEMSSSFTRLLVSLMKAAQWDLDAACDSIEVGIKYARRADRKYALESYICQQMWNGFENDDFYIFGGISSVIDPEKRRKECFDEYLDIQATDPLQLISVNPDCLFGKFCHKKFLQLVHPKMEISFFGNFEHRNHITEGRHPNSQFYQSFLRLAKTVWLVHRLANSFNPTANIFQVRRGTRFSPSCMISVVMGMELDENQLPAKVGFSVMPGFRLGTLVIKSQVYLESSETKTDRVA
ncbi:hypothetical protein KP509_05G003500 [Ceratopteris richardii]|nr:hypothetical protein KP509_05G003500 [Ceratopteris richardii]